MVYSKEEHNIEVTESNDSTKIDYSKADLALQYAEKTEGYQYTAEQDRAVLRKLDIYVTPLICFIYAVQYMDKVTVSYTSIMGLRTDLGLVGDQYSWLGSGFYLGYLVFEYPFVRLLQRFPLIKTLSIFTFIWGAVLTLNAASFNFGSILASRIFLGAFESAVTPALVNVTARFFKKEEQFSRVTFWFSSNGIGAILGGSIAYGIARHQSHIAVHSWKILFIITGLLTIVLSILIFFYLPETPSEAWFLNEEERIVALERIRGNQQGFGSKKFKGYQFKEVFKDPRTYLYCLHGVCSTIPNGGLGNFGSILINDSFGYSKLKSLLIGLPAGAVQVFSAFLVFGLVKLTNQRTLVGIFAYSISFMASCMLAFAKSKSTQLAGYYLLNFGGIGWVTVLSLITTNTLGYTKKNTTSAFYFISYCAGNIVGPQTFRVKDEPDYVPAKTAIAALQLVSLVLLGLIYLLNIWDNKKRDKEAERLGEDYYTPPKNAEFLDLTDFENRNFRYFV